MAVGLNLVAVNCRLLPATCLSVFDHFLGLAHKGLKPAVILFIKMTLINTMTRMHGVYSHNIY